MRIIRKIEPSAHKLPARKRVAAYARVSSGKDASLQSLSAQVSYYSQYIQRHLDWEYAGVYADEAISGTKQFRSEFQRLIADCRAGKIDMIITKSISRFARNTVYLLETVREMRELNVDVYFERENIHSMSSDGELMLSILASFAQEESRSVSENCKWRIRRNFENGDLWGLGMLYGYKIKKGKIEVDLEQAGVVRMIFEDYISGMGGSLIAKKIRRMKIPAFYGGAWNADCITEVIKNEKYTGNALLQKHYVKDHLSKLLISNRGALAKYYAQGTHPAIVDMAMFEKAQMIMENRRKKFKTKDNSHKRYPFSGLIRCENCGKNYKRRVCSGKAYWQCSTYLKKGKAFCHTKQIPEPILYEICADVLGLDCFDEDKFLEEIIEIKIPDFNHLVFAFCDGHTVEKVWKDRLRSESWDEAMRESTRQRTMERRSSK